MLCKQQRFATRQTGLTLIELMVVVAVIAVITTIALPGFQTATKRSNEASAIASLKNILTAQNQYKVRFGAFGGVPELYAAGLIDQNFEDNAKSGYTFQNVSAPTSAQWELEAVPDVNTGDRFFYVDSSGVIRFKDSAQAGPTDPPVDGG
jgi:type IV pilus assembly protein PilE